MKAPRNMPVHEFIKQQLRRKIERGDLVEGDVLPSENELARQFEVSRTLARQALRELEIEGIVIRSQGARSRVAGTPAPRPVVSFQQARILALAFIGVQSKYTRTIIEKFTERAYELGYHVLAYSLWLDNEEQYEFLRTLRQSGVAGLGLGLWQDCDSAGLRELIREYIGSSFPIVQIDRMIPDLDGGDAVGSDNERIGERLTASLIARGHRRIGFIADSIQTTSIRDRLAGYRAALETEGVAAEETLVVEVDRGGERAASAKIRKLLRGAKPPTAFFCANEYLMSELRDILAEMGRDLGAEFGLAVVDDSQASERLSLPAVKAIQSAEAIGASSAECLISRIATPKQPPRRLQVPAKFVDPPKT